MASGNFGTTPSVPRVGGSGFTALQWQGETIAFAQTLSHQSPQPVAAPVAIQPLDQRYPLDIVTPAAIGPGTLQLAVYELYNEKVWDRIMQIIDNKAGGQGNNVLPTYNDLSEVFVRLANIDPSNGGIRIAKVVYPPTAFGSARRYADIFHGVKITDIRDDENIDIGTMDMAKVITCQYRYSTRQSDANTTTYSTIFGR